MNHFGRRSDHRNSIKVGRRRKLLRDTVSRDRSNNIKLFSSYQKSVVTCQRMDPNYIEQREDFRENLTLGLVTALGEFNIGFGNKASHFGFFAQKASPGFKMSSCQSTSRAITLQLPAGSSDIQPFCHMKSKTFTWLRMGSD